MLVANAVFQTWTLMGLSITLADEICEMRTIWVLDLNRSLRPTAMASQENIHQVAV